MYNRRVPLIPGHSDPEKLKKLLEDDNIFVNMNYELSFLGLLNSLLHEIYPDLIIVAAASSDDGETDWISIEKFHLQKKTID